MFGLGKKTWIIGGVLIALVGTTAWATKMHNRSPEDRAAWATERVTKKLNLDDGQKAAFEKVADEMVAMRGLRTEFMTDSQSQTNIMHHCYVEENEYYCIVCIYTMNIIFVCTSLAIFFQDNAKKYMRMYNVAKDVQNRVLLWYFYTWRR